MNLPFVFALLGGALAIGILVGLWISVGVHANLDRPQRPGRIERMRIRKARRAEFKARRDEFIRTGTLAPRRSKRVETW
jgi:hypothetical protein